MTNGRRVAWLTDIHIDLFVDTANHEIKTRYERFVQNLLEMRPDAVLLGGDTATSATLLKGLERLARRMQQCPVYFVLGNEDFHGDSIASVRHEVNQLSSRHQTLSYLSTNTEPIELTESVALIGHDGWPDGRFAKIDVPGSALPRDYVDIQELREAGEEGRWHVLSALGDQAAEHFHRLLSKLCSGSISCCS